MGCKLHLSSLLHLVPTTAITYQTWHSLQLSPDSWLWNHSLFSLEQQLGHGHWVYVHPQDTEIESKRIMTEKYWYECKIKCKDQLYLVLSPIFPPPTSILYFLHSCVAGSMLCQASHSGYWGQRVKCALTSEEASPLQCSGMEGGGSPPLISFLFLLLKNFSIWKANLSWRRGSIV